MLAFLRRYQRYFLWVITIMIIISFSFFGTYGVMEQRLPSDPIAFHTVDGEEVRQSQLRAMMTFLSSDAADAMLFSGRGNIFNDGVLANDFLQAPLGLKLMQAFSADLQPDLKTRLMKEKKARFYQHPEAPFLSSEIVWGYFIPQTTQHLATLRQAENPMSQAALAARIQLYTDQRRFSGQDLKRVLVHQERQYDWIDHDPNLGPADLSMFGYHTLEDWFGPHFIRVVAEFILNTAAIAEKRGVQVTTEEAMADLMQQAEKSYKQLPPKSQTVGSWQVYFEQQMERLGLNGTQLVDVWRKVLLFRRLFEGVGSALFLDPLSFEDFSRYALTRVETSRYALPKEVWIPSESVLQQFETYLSLVGEPANGLLALPNRWKDPQTLLKKYPELVYKSYHVAVSEVSRRQVQAQVGLQEMWDWQTDPNNWSKLTQEFPELALHSANTPEERLNMLDKLPKSSRARIDATTRSMLVALHPEWLERALEQAPVHKKVWMLPFAGKSEHLPELTQPEELIALLDRAPIGGESLLPALARYSPMGDTFYRIRLLEPPSELAIRPFDVAKNTDVLKNALKAQLEAHWLKVRERDPAVFKANGAFRPFEEVQGAVAELYFKPLFDALQKAYQAAFASAKEPQGSQESPSRNRLAAFRLYPYVQSIAEQLETSSTPEGPQERLWVRPEESKNQEPSKRPLVQDQFLLLKQPVQLIRREYKENMPEEALFGMEPGEWSALFNTPEGALSFYHVLEKGIADPTATILQQMNQVRSALQQEAQGLLMDNLLQNMLSQKKPPFSERKTPSMADFFTEPTVVENG